MPSSCYFLFVFYSYLFLFPLLLPHYLPIIPLSTHLLRVQDIEAVPFYYLLSFLLPIPLSTYAPFPFLLAYPPSPPIHPLSSYPRTIFRSKTSRSTITYFFFFLSTIPFLSFLSFSLECHPYNIPYFFPSLSTPIPLPPSPPILPLSTYPRTFFGSMSSRWFWINCTEAWKSAWLNS